MNRRHSTRRLAALLATVGLAVGALTACSRGGGDAALPSDGSVAPDLQTVLDRGAINIGSCYSSPPWAQLNSSGKPEGFDIDMAQDFAKYLGVELNSSDIAPAGRVPALQSGQLDAIMCSFGRTPEREQQIDFSDATIKLGWSLITPADSDISSVDDMTGRTIAVTRGGLAVPVLTAANPNAQQLQFDATADALLAVKSGQADGLVDLSSSVTLWNQQDPDNTKVAIDGTLGDPLELGIGIAKDRPGLLQAANEFLAEWHADGRGKEEYAKWFNQEPTFQFEGLED